MKQIFFQQNFKINNFKNKLKNNLKDEFTEINELFSLDKKGVIIIVLDSSLCVIPASENHPKMEEPPLLMIKLEKL